VERDTPCPSILLAAEMDTPFTSILPAVKRDTPCTSILLAVEIDTLCWFWCMVVKGIAMQCTSKLQIVKSDTIHLAHP
jgi:hypothetical protein